MSAAAPLLAERVPESLRGAAWRAELAAAVQAGRPAAALAAARRAVIADPLDAGSVSGLALARFAAGDGPGAAAAFRVAGALGWRDGPTQLYLMTAALQGGELEVAADRLDATLRQRPRLEQAAALLAPFEATGAGRRALAVRLAARPAWLDLYLTPGTDTPGAQLEDRVAVLREPALRPARLGCTDVAPLVSALIAAGRAAAARTLRADRCAAAAGLLSDGGFDRASPAPGAVQDWEFPGAAGIEVQVGPAAGFAGRAVLVESTLPSRQVFARQAVQLSPGRYRIAWRSSGDAGEARMRAAVRCGGDIVAPTPAREAESGRFAVVAAVPDGCDRQTFELTILPGAGRIAIDDVTIQPLAGGG
ncbi:MAG: hypothetical protein ABW194_08500 [Novosphingobium sp.]